MSDDVAVKPVRLELTDALKGHHILVDPDAVDMEFLVSLQSTNAGTLLAALSAAVVGGDLPKGTDRAGLGKLKPVECRAVCNAVATVHDIPKAT